MSYFGGIHIVNKYGYAKTFDIQKALVMVGSGKGNDIVLSAEQGGGVAAMHLQLIFPQWGEPVCRVLNLAVDPLKVAGGPSAGVLLKSHAMTELKHGDVVRVGDFTLTLQIWADRGMTVVNRSPNLSLKLQMPGSHLHPEKSLSGLLTLSNLGNERRCQFKIEIYGIQKDCYQVGSAPLLFPGASEDLLLQFIHQGARPPAGRQLVTISATAPQAYPTEEVSLQFDLDVAEFYQFEMELEEDALPEVPIVAEVSVVGNQSVDISLAESGAVDLAGASPTPWQPSWQGTAFVNDEAPIRQESFLREEPARPEVTARPVPDVVSPTEPAPVVWPEPETSTWTAASVPQQKSPALSGWLDSLTPAIWEVKETPAVIPTAVEEPPVTFGQAVDAPAENTSPSVPVTAERQDQEAVPVPALVAEQYLSAAEVVVPVQAPAAETKPPSQPVQAPKVELAAEPKPEVATRLPEVKKPVSVDAAPKKPVTVIRSQNIDFDEDDRQGPSVQGQTPSGGSIRPKPDARTVKVIKAGVDALDDILESGQNGGGL